MIVPIAAYALRPRDVCHEAWLTPITRRKTELKVAFLPRRG